jgi:hypothetical protein
MESTKLNKKPTPLQKEMVAKIKELDKLTLNL